ncbi:MAG: hypothetical protein ABEJ99_01325 [Candidatus Nanohaloarchaea archaeon]
MNPKQKLVALHRKYGLDKREMGKVLIIASTTLMLVAIQTVLTLQHAEKQVSDASNSMNRADAILSDSNFQRSIDQLQNLPQSSLTNNLNAVMHAFENAKSSADKINKAETNLEKDRKMYQWLVVIGILGDVAGVAIVFA